MSTIQVDKRKHQPWEGKYDIGQVRKLMGKDLFTEACNIDKLNNFIEMHREIYARYRYPFCLISFSIDQYVELEKSCNHADLQNFLITLVDIINHRIRNTDIIARIVDADFCVVSPFTGLDGAAVLAEDLRTQIASHNFFISDEITASFGLSSIREIYTSRKDLLNTAVANMHTAALEGNNVIVA